MWAGNRAHFTELNFWIESPMQLRKTMSGFMMIVLAAFAGLALIYLPNWLLSNYKAAAELGQIWGTLYLSVVGSGLFLVTASAVWIVWKLWGASIYKKRRRQRRDKNPSQLSHAQQQRELDENLKQIEALKTKTDGQEEINRQLDPLVRQVLEKREQQVLEIVAFGTISSGKSSVLNLLAGRNVFATDTRGGTTVTRNEIPWPGMDRVTLVDTPGLGEVDGESHVHIASESAKDADLVILVVDGPLRASEHELLDRLGKMEKRIVVCLNKVDWYSDQDREKLIGQIQHQTQPFVRAEDIVSIQAETGSRVRRRVQVDGSEIEEQVDVPPSIEPLADRMMVVLRQDGKELLAANLLLQSRGLVEKARNRVQESIDKKAWAIVDKYMWGAGGVAAINPFPIVDLAAGTAISSKMILDLAEVYQQKVDLETASQWLSEMGKNLVGFLGAQGATIAVTSVAASLIKTVPLAGTIAGGVLQGAVQALITKWIGAVFIEYFRNEMNTPEGGLAGLARRQWDVVTSVDELRKLVQSARSKLGSSKVSS